MKQLYRVTVINRNWFASEEAMIHFVEAESFNDADAKAIALCVNWFNKESALGHEDDDTEWGESEWITVNAELVSVLMDKCQAAIAALNKDA